MPLSTEQFRSLSAELDALRAEYAAKVGDRDAEYIRAVQAIARASHVAGRLLIHFSLEPVSWSAGVLALATYKILENMEIGHNILHGQYDFLHDPRLSSATYEWDMVGTSKSWKRAHNATHHVYAAGAGHLRAPRASLRERTTPLAVRERHAPARPVRAPRKPLRAARLPPGRGRGLRRVAPLRAGRTVRARPHVPFRAT